MPDGTALIGIGLVGLSFWVVVFVMWPKSQLDRYRQRLFAIRDDLFMKAAEGQASFNDPAYGLLRMLINQLIYTSSSTTGLQAMLALMALGRNKRPAERFTLQHKLIEQLRGMENSKRLVYIDVYSQVSIESVSYLLRTSIVVWLYFGVQAARRAIGRQLQGIHMVRKRLGRWWIEYGNRDADHWQEHVRLSA